MRARKKVIILQIMVLLTLLGALLLTISSRMSVVPAQTRIETKKVHAQSWFLSRYVDLCFYLYVWRSIYRDSGRMLYLQGVLIDESSHTFYNLG